MKKNKYLWASPHTPSNEQLKSLTGHFDLLESHDNPLQDEISQISIDTDLTELATRLIRFAAQWGYTHIVQPGGSPKFQFVLGTVWENFNEFGYHGKGRLPLIMYAFSQRISKDIPQEDGSIRKISVFKHEGWV